MQTEKEIKEKIKFLQMQYEDHLDQLHPIDHLLCIANEELGYKWYSLLRYIGIDYNTPCAFINNDDEWADFTDFGRYTYLIVSRQSFKLLSHDTQLYQDGIVATDLAIYKDKKHLNHAMIAFDHSITKEAYLELIIGKPEEIYNDRN